MIEAHCNDVFSMLVLLLNETKKVIYHFFHLSDEGSPNNKKEKSVKMSTKAI